MPRSPLGRFHAAVLESLVDGVLAIDRSGTLLLANPVSRALFDLSPAAVGAKIWAVLPGQPFVKALTEAAAQRHQAPLEQVFSQPSGRLLLVQIRPVAGERGRSAGAIALFKDLTELRQIDAAVNTFVANVSHEFKTPLTSIKGFVETLLEGAAEDPVVTRRFLQVINEETNRLTRLIVSLLDMARPGRSARSRSLQPVSVAALIRNAAEILGPLAAAKNLRVDLDLPGDLPLIRADSDALMQVIVNLLDNAIKYTGFVPEGGGVRIAAWADGRAIRLEVADAGIGISSKDQHRIFERFYRVSTGPSAQLGGTGLGLAITKEIVESHGGTISVSSQAGKGSTFTVRLPLGPVAVRTDRGDGSERVQATAAPRSAAPPAGRRKSARGGQGAKSPQRAPKGGSR